jgi:NTE family protein
VKIANRKQEKALSTASSYGEWREAAKAWDHKQGHDRWRLRDQSSQFDYVSIRLRLDRLRALRARHDNRALLYTLGEGIHGNMGGMGKATLYERALTGTKHLISDYVEEIVDALQLLARPEVDDISFEEKLDFFRRAHHCFGRSAFMMSGSGMLLYFHVGVVKALWQQGLLPNILSGASGGSVVGALLATHSDRDLERIFDPENLVYRLEREEGLLESLRNLKPQPLLQDQIIDMIAHFIPDMTFQESYDLTGRMLNVSIAPAETHQTSRLLNATTAPNVLIRSACLASAAVPGVFAPVTLQARDSWGDVQPYLPSRKWVDGSVSDDMPTKRLSRLYGVNHYIVSQTNPAVLPFVSDGKRLRGAGPILANTARRTAREWVNALAEIMHKPLSKETPLAQVANVLLSVVNQDYVGDINILPRNRFAHPLKVLHHISVEEATALMEDGERAAWRHMEMIRVQTRISTVLDDIMQGYEQDLRHQLKVPARKKAA